AEDDQLLHSARVALLLAENIGGVGLHDDSRLEVTSCVVPQVLVGAAREAIDAGVLAAAIGVDAPAEAEPRRVRTIDDRLALDLFEGDPRCHDVSRTPVR